MSKPISTGQVVTSKNTFRIKVSLAVAICGSVAIWLLVFGINLTQRQNFQSDVLLMIRGQARSVVEEFSLEYHGAVMRIRSDTERLSQEVEQNPEQFSTETRIADLVPPQVAVYMLNEPFQTVYRALRRIHQDIDRVNGEELTGDLRTLTLERIYLVENINDINTSDLVRVIADSEEPITNIVDRLWPGKYIRGSNNIPYDDLYRGLEITGRDFERKDVVFDGVPLYTPTGEIIAGMIFEYDLEKNFALLRARTRRNILIAIQVTVLYFLASYILIFVLFRPLRRLRRNAIAILNKDLSSRAYMRKRDELSLIGRGTDALADKLHETREDLNRVSRIRNNLIPPQFLDYLNKQSINNLIVGEYAERYMNILSIAITYPGLHGSTYSSPREVIDTVNDYISLVSEIIENKSGFIEHATETSMCVLFPGSADDAVTSANAIHQQIIVRNKEREQSEDKQVAFHIGIHRGTTAVGMIGHKRFLRPLVVSDAVRVSNHIAEVAVRIGANTVISDSLHKNILNALNYQTRYLGNIPLGIIKATEIYDVIDSYNEHLYKLIMATRIDFVEAVRYFEHGYYKRAIDILDLLVQTNPDDDVARYFRTFLREKHEHGVAKTK